MRNLFIAVAMATVQCIHIESEEDGLQLAQSEVGQIGPFVTMQNYQYVGCFNDRPYQDRNSPIWGRVYDAETVDGCRVNVERYQTPDLIGVNTQPNIVPGFNVRCSVGIFSPIQFSSPYFTYGLAPFDDCKTINGGKKSFHFYVRKQAPIREDWTQRGCFIEKPSDSLGQFSNANECINAAHGRGYSVASFYNGKECWATNAAGYDRLSLQWSTTFHSCQNKVYTRHRWYHTGIYFRNLPVVRNFVTYVANVGSWEECGKIAKSAMVSTFMVTENQCHIGNLKVDYSKLQRNAAAVLTDNNLGLNHVFFEAHYQ